MSQLGLELIILGIAYHCEVGNKFVNANLNHIRGDSKRAIDSSIPGD